MARNGNHDDSTGKRIQSGEDSQEPAYPTLDEHYFVAHPQRRNPLAYIYNMLKRGQFAQTSAPAHMFAGTTTTITRQEQLAMFLMQSLRYLSCPLAKIGQVVEITGNVIVANGGVIRTLCRLLYSALFFFFRENTLLVPARDSADFMSLVGLTDPRKDLVGADTVESTASDHGDTNTSNDIFPGRAVGDRRIADLMLMASKFAYENDALVKEVVNNSWKMNFVGFYNCWNEYQQRFNKQVFIFTDKAHDANAIVVAWRGTDPFIVDDLITDVDFSWYDLQGDVGRVHLGFLECLGLGDRHNMNTFIKLRKNSLIQKEKKNERTREFQPEGSHISPSPPASGLSKDIIDAPEKILAYDDITKVVKDLLKKNPKAKLFLTGHSLGGALSMLYAGMLYYFGETFVTDRIASVYTFGQPRTGDKTFCQFMLDNLKLERYFRVVYSNDIVPRLPFDDSFFSYKHWGHCFYFNNRYTGLMLKEEPFPNYFSTDIWSFFSKHVNALEELTASLVGEHGPKYNESLTSFLIRVLALFLPGLGAHSLVNYCNAVRLGAPMPLGANPGILISAGDRPHMHRSDSKAE